MPGRATARPLGLPCDQGQRPPSRRAGMGSHSLNATPHMQGYENKITARCSSVVLDRSLLPRAAPLGASSAPRPPSGCEGTPLPLPGADAAPRPRPLRPFGTARVPRGAAHYKEFASALRARGKNLRDWSLLVRRCTIHNHWFNVRHTDTAPTPDFYCRLCGDYTVYTRGTPALRGPTTERTHATVQHQFRMDTARRHLTQPPRPLDTHRHC